MSLTDAQIKRLKPSADCKPARPDKYSDRDGLYILVRPTGTKSWLVQYRQYGKQKSKTLGKYPQISLSEARRLTLELKQQLASGLDPKRPAQIGASFAEFADRWYAERKSQLAPGTWLRDHNLYLRDIRPAIGHLGIDQITPPDVLKIGKAVQGRGSTDMGHRAIQEVAKIFKVAKAEGLVMYNPATDLAPALKQHKSKHYARVSATELPELLQRIDQLPDDMIRHGLNLLCYSMLRTSELRKLKWSEIDWDYSVIRLSPERMKMRRPHIVPLTRQMILILKDIKARKLSKRWVFIGNQHRVPMHQNVFIQTLWKMGYKGKMTGHGFRGIASTVLHEQGFMHDAIELQLAHEKADKVSAAYNGAEHLEYRVQMMQAYSDFIDAARSGDLIKMDLP